MIDSESPGTKLADECKLQNGQLFALSSCLRFAQLKPRISSVFRGPFCVRLTHSLIQILPVKGENRNTCWRAEAEVTSWPFYVVRPFFEVIDLKPLLMFSFYTEFQMVVLPCFWFHKCMTKGQMEPKWRPRVTAFVRDALPGSTILERCGSDTKNTARKVI